jgi:hypothetical protein
VGRAGAISTLPQLCADRKTAPFSTYLLYYRARLKALVPKAVRVMRIVCESPAFDVFSGFHIQRRLVHTLKTRNSPAGDPREGSEPETGSHPATGHFGTKRKRVAGMRLAKGSLRLAWRMGVFLGTVLLGAGIVMIVTPGPAVVFIPLGLGVLATEFQWGSQPACQSASNRRPRARKGQGPEQAESPPNNTGDDRPRRPCRVSLAQRVSFTPSTRRHSFFFWPPPRSNS